VPASTTVTATADAAAGHAVLANLDLVVKEGGRWRWR
jgi:hypothetical protein